MDVRERIRLVAAVVATAAAIVAAVAGSGCAAHTKEAATAPGTWTSPTTAGPYDVRFHLSWQPRTRQCLLAAIDGRWSDWAVSVRGVSQIGRRRTGAIYVHSLGADIGPTSSVTPNINWTGTGDGNAIHVRPADHRLPGLMVAIDAHQDPLLETTLDPARQPLLLRLDAQSLVNLFPIQQAIACHQP